MTMNSSAPTKVATLALINCPCESCVKARPLGLFVDKGGGWAAYFETPEAMSFYLFESLPEASSRYRARCLRDSGKKRRLGRKVQRRARKAGRAG